MKALKITLALLAITVLTVSGVKSEDVVVDNEPTYKEYSPKDLLAVDKKKLKVGSRL
ncbi:hypothetical protein [Winogradskyella flava]|uniref:hypothetical protein n=1 Tax=Winogradskyella flava TaxID=1884876 RepID=UPI0024937248|nr:hypothetical protein [Winogradskyella flava]